MWIAKRRQKVDGIFVEPGTPVPSAATWPNLHWFVATGHVEWVEDFGSPGPETPPSSDSEQAKEARPKRKRGRPRKVLT